MSRASAASTRRSCCAPPARCCRKKDWRRRRGAAGAGWARPWRWCSWGRSPSATGARPCRSRRRWRPVPTHRLRQPGWPSRRRPSLAAGARPWMKVLRRWQPLLWKPPRRRRSVRRLPSGWWGTNRQPGTRRLKPWRRNPRRRCRRAGKVFRGNSARRGPTRQPGPGPGCSVCGASSPAPSTMPRPAPPRRRTGCAACWAAAPAPCCNTMTARRCYCWSAPAVAACQCCCATFMAVTPCWRSTASRSRCPWAPWSGTGSASTACCGRHRPAAARCCVPVTAAATCSGCARN